MQQPASHAEMLSTGALDAVLHLLASSLDQISNTAGAWQSQVCHLHHSSLDTTGMSDLDRKRLNTTYLILAVVHKMCLGAIVDAAYEVKTKQTKTL